MSFFKQKGYMIVLGLVMMSLLAGMVAGCGDENISQADAEEQYATYYTPITDDLADNLDYIGDLFSRAANDPTLLYDDAWTDDLIAAIKEQKALIDKAQSYDGPIPDDFAKGHELFMKGIDEYEKYNKLLPDAMVDLLAGDNTKVQTCIDYMNKGNAYIVQASKEFNRVAAERGN